MLPPPNRIRPFADRVQINVGIERGIRRPRRRAARPLRLSGVWNLKWRQEVTIRNQLPLQPQINRPGEEQSDAHHGVHAEECLVHTT